MKQDKLRAIGIDLGTTNSAAAELTWDPASGAPPSVRVLEIEQPTREGWMSFRTKRIRKMIFRFYNGVYAGRMETRS